MVNGNDGTGTRERRDHGHLGLRLDDFAGMKEAVRAELSMAEVAALRLYTTSTFRLINDPLRAHAPKHPLAVTVLHISRALKKLRALHMHSEEVRAPPSYHPLHVRRLLTPRVELRATVPWTTPLVTIASPTITAARTEHTMTPARRRTVPGWLTSSSHVTCGAGSRT